MSDDSIDTARTILEATTKAARRLHPQLGLSFGYIGNLEWAPKRDDRRWAVFAKLSTKPCPTACDVSWGRFRTEQLGEMAAAAALGDVFDWADRQAVLLADGKLYQVCPGSWLEEEIAHAAAWPTRTRVAAGL